MESNKKKKAKVTFGILYAFLFLHAIGGTQICVPILANVQLHESFCRIDDEALFVGEMQKGDEAKGR
jgi:hypothetical protein